MVLWKENSIQEIVEPEYNVTKRNQWIYEDFYNKASVVEDAEERSHFFEEKKVDELIGFGDERCQYSGKELARLQWAEAYLKWVVYFRFLL